jgi:short-subunit dehydrogenase
VKRTILVLGATSAIALAYCRHLAVTGGSFVLVGRRNDRLQTIAADLRSRGAGSVKVVVSDLSDMTDCEKRFIEFCAVLGTPDQVLLAYGVLGDQGDAEAVPDETRRIIDVNFTSAALWLHASAKQLPRDKPRTIIAIGSVAGERGRRSNYVYGAAKAGLAAFAEGLAHRLHGTNLHILLVKPGLVDTPMTAHIDRSGPLWADPDTIAACIDRAVRRRRPVAYCPWFWAVIMSVIRSLPRPIFFRTKL